jgi:hypothetical protein
MYWAGDNGVIVTFSETGYYGSDIEQELNKRQAPWNSTTQAYVWYLDFKTSQISLVTPFGLASPAVQYSPEKNGFYYVRYGEPIPESDQNVSTPLVFYSLADKREKTIVSVPDAHLVSYITACPGDDTICLLKKDENETSIYSASKQKLEKQKFNDTSYNDIVPTTSSTTFVGVRYSETNSQASEDEILTAHLDRISPVDNTATKLSAKIPVSGTIYANTLPDDSFYLIEPSHENGSGITILAASKNLLGSYRAKTVHLTNEEDFTESVALLEPITRANDGSLLFKNVDDVMYLLTPDTSTLQASDSIRNNLLVEKNLKKCFDTNSMFHTYSDSIRQFKIGVAYDAGYRQKIADFSRCVADTDPEGIVSYTFVFIGVDPDSGRFVTN